MTTPDPERRGRSVRNVTPRQRSTYQSATWLSPEQVCDHVPGLTVTQLRDMRSQGRGPRYEKPTRTAIVYDLADVDAWVRASVVSTRDQR